MSHAIITVTDIIKITQTVYAADLLSRTYNDSFTYEVGLSFRPGLLNISNDFSFRCTQEVFEELDDYKRNPLGDRSFYIHVARKWPYALTPSALTPSENNGTWYYFETEIYQKLIKKYPDKALPEDKIQIKIVKPNIICNILTLEI